MKNILVIGAGRSASVLIGYLLKEAETKRWNVRVGDMDGKMAKEKCGSSSRGTGFQFDINDAAQREREIAESDVVVSMLPAFMHGAVAKDCVRVGKHLVTASYISEEMRALDDEAKKKNIILLNEIGLDPGIDHMSAMEVIDKLRASDCKLKAFYSYCGGLVAPESNDNPWGYKFSWNPRNVILAGQGTAQYIENGAYKFLPYNRLFSSARTIEVEGHGKFDAYANRDSLGYRSVYGIENIPTMLRGTLRAEGFCKAWNVFVQLGLTDDTWKIAGSADLTYHDWVESFLPAGNGNTVNRVAALAGCKADSNEMKRVEWTGIFSDEKIPLRNASPAQILQELLERKWKLKPGDKDMIVMQHQFIYAEKGIEKKLIASLVVKGDDEVHTAMAKTVGLPAAIAVKLILDGKIKRSGVSAPVTPDLYVQILAELRSFGVNFTEKITSL